MSGVYIEMEMPQSCFACRFAVDGWCYAYGKPNITALANDGVTNFCPLIPVPPHGDLIDKQVADELNLLDYQAMGSDTFTDYARKVVQNCLNAAPIVIPANRGKGQNETDDLIDRSQEEIRV